MQTIRTLHASGGLNGQKVEAITLDRKDMQSLQAMEENQPGAIAEWFAKVMCRF
jgi:hypothetical protein